MSATRNACRCYRPKLATENGISYCIDCGHELGLSSQRPEQSSPIGDKTAALAALIVQDLADHLELDHPEPWIDVERAAEHLACKPQRIYD